MWNHKGFNIEIDPNGLFTAEVGDIKISYETLAQVRDKIDKLPKQKRQVRLAIVARLVDADEWRDSRTDSIFHGTLTGINRGSRKLQVEDVPKDKAVRDVMPDTQENANLLAALSAAKATVEQLTNQVQEKLLSCKGYGKIEPAEYDALLAVLEAKYKTILGLDLDAKDKP